MSWAGFCCGWVRTAPRAWRRRWWACRGRRGPRPAGRGWPPASPRPPASCPTPGGWQSSFILLLTRRRRHLAMSSLQSSRRWSCEICSRGPSYDASDLRELGPGGGRGVEEEEYGEHHPHLHTGQFIRVSSHHSFCLTQNTHTQIQSNKINLKRKYWNRWVTKENENI